MNYPELGGRSAFIAESFNSFVRHCEHFGERISRRFMAVQSGLGGLYFSNKFELEMRLRPNYRKVNFRSVRCAYPIFWINLQLNISNRINRHFPGVVDHLQRHSMLIWVCNLTKSSQLFVAFSSISRFPVRAQAYQNVMEFNRNSCILRFGALQAICKFDVVFRHGEGDLLFIGAAKNHRRSIAPLIQSVAKIADYSVSSLLQLIKIVRIDRYVIRINHDPFAGFVHALRKRSWIFFKQFADVMGKLTDIAIRPFNELQRRIKSVNLHNWLLASEPVACEATS